MWCELPYLHIYVWLDLISSHLIVRSIATQIEPELQLRINILRMFVQGQVQKHSWRHSVPVTGSWPSIKSSSLPSGWAATEVIILPCTHVFTHCMKSRLYVARVHELEAASLAGDVICFKGAESSAAAAAVSSGGRVWDPASSRSSRSS